MQIFLKKNAFFGEKEVFFVFFGVAVMGLEGIETIKTIEAIVWHFFCRRGAQASSESYCFFSAFSFVLLPSRCRLFAVLLPSFCRLCFEIDGCWY